MRAANHLGVLGGGQSEPHLFADENGEVWVVKLPGNPFESQLGTDYLGLQLAPFLGVPVPESRPITVDEESLATMQARPSWAREGLGLATRYFRGVENVTPMALADGHETLSRLIVLDAWLETLDRKRPDGQWNLLRLTGPDVRYLAIDFGMSMQHRALLGSIATANPLPPGYPEELIAAADLRGVQTAMFELAAISDEVIQTTIESVPSAMMNPSDQRGILEFLVQRRRAVCSLSAGALLRGSG